MKIVSGTYLSGNYFYILFCGKRNSIKHTLCWYFFIHKTSLSCRNAMTRKNAKKKYKINRLKGIARKRNIKVLYKKPTRKAAVSEKLVASQRKARI